MNVEVTVCLPREASTVGLVRGMVSSALERLGVADDCIDDIKLALSEACTNVVDHAVDGDEYEVRVAIEDRRCAIRVVDTGGHLDLVDLRGHPPDVVSPRGRGVAIMQAVMDRVDFVSQPESGTIVHLVKALVLRPGGPRPLNRDR